MILSLIWATLAGAVLGSLADWLFAGILFHDRYQTYPEVWRIGDERGRIILAQALAIVTAGAFSLLVWRLGPMGLRASLELAFMIWLIGPLPLLLGNHLFIKLDPLVTASHAAGWLVKLLLVGAAAAWLL